MSNQIKHKRPKYTLEFKKDAAKLVIEKGYTHEQAATNLGISTSALGVGLERKNKQNTKLVFNYCGAYTTYPRGGAQNSARPSWLACWIAG